mgnify:CR=1 FL=1|jgi:hypothetical protein|tara:strand:+ start:471 stop:1118 length:648 start_codon:yes stop_codon:yes gene_type:complete
MVVEKMKEIKAQEGYERIGSYDVNLSIPEVDRKQFRENMEAMEKGKLSEHRVTRFSLFNIIVDHYMRETGITDFTRDQKITMVRKELLDDYEADIPELRTDQCPVYQALKGETKVDLTPDPFIGERDYLRLRGRDYGQDHYNFVANMPEVKTKAKDGIIEFTIRLNGVDGSQPKDVLRKIPFEDHDATLAKVVVDINKRESRIEPLSAEEKVALR